MKRMRQVLGANMSSTEMDVFYHMQDVVTTAPVNRTDRGEDKVI